MFLQHVLFCNVCDRSLFVCLFFQWGGIIYLYIKFFDANYVNKLADKLA